MFKQKYHANDGYYLHVSSTVLLDKGPSFYSSPYKLPLTYMYFTSDVKYVYFFMEMTPHLTIDCHKKMLTSFALTWST